MKIVVTGTRGIPNIMGGVETHCEELFPRVARLGADVTVICRSKYVDCSLHEWNGVNLVDVEAPDNKSLEAIVHTFRGIVKARKLKADVVHIHAVGPALLVPFAKMLGMKVVFTHHGPDYDRDKWGCLAKTVLRLGERIGCRFADDVIVISSVIKDIVKQKHGRSKGVHLIYNGVPSPEVCSCPEYFSELGIEEGKYMLAMCRFVPEKRLDDLIKAFVKTKHGDGIKLVLAGDTDFENGYSRSLKKLACNNGVVLTGFLKGRKLHALLSNARCFCLPSSHEGLPIALLEAMSYRLPVVVSDIPANKDVGLSPDCYFPCKDVSVLAERLQTQIDAPLHRVDYDMTKYSWDTIARQTYQVYQQMTH